MEEKILCPWCGAEMEARAHKNRSNAIGWTKCQNIDCGADGPIVTGKTAVECADKARAAAMRRYTPPPIKPMTLEEAIDARAVWTELQTNEPENNLTASLFAWHSEGRRVVFLEQPGEDDDDGGKIVGHNPLDYGRTWRCWERKPTDEERSAAEWETSKQE